MKVYIAAAHGKKDDIKLYTAPWLRENGFEVVSTWHDVENPGYNDDYELMRAEAMRDISEIKSADTLVKLRDSKASVIKSKGGKFEELGYALALSKRVVVIGDREGILEWHPEVHQFHTLFEFITEVKGNEKVL